MEGGRGKVRIHKPPDRVEVAACSRWWRRELEIVRPEVLLCLGATAGRAVRGPSFRVGRERGTFVVVPGLPEDLLVGATIHPSAVLRAPGRDRAGALDGLVRDLADAWSVATGGGAGTSSSRRDRPHHRSP